MRSVVADILELFRDFASIQVQLRPMSCELSCEMAVAKKQRSPSIPSLDQIVW